MRLLTLPNCLSLSRIVLALPTAWSLMHGPALATGVLFALAVLSDLVDGPLARRERQTAPLGTVVDHGSDAVFVTVQCAAGASLGLLPPLLPVLIAVAFIQYARGIYAPHPERWRGSGLGRWNGIGYFVVVGTLIAVRHALADDPTAEQLLYAFGWGLTASTAISIVERAARARHRG